MKASRIAQSDLCAVSVCEGGKARVDGCLIAGSRGPGICAVDLGDAVRRGPPPPLPPHHHHHHHRASTSSPTSLTHISHPTFPRQVARHCVLRDGHEAGVLVSKRGRRGCSATRCLANSRPGVVVCRGGVASLARNKIHSGREEGVWVCERSAAVLVENEVHALGRVSDLSGRLSHTHSSHPAPVTPFSPLYRCTTTRTPACRHVTPDLSPTFSGAQQRARRCVGVVGRAHRALAQPPPPRPVRRRRGRGGGDHRRRRSHTPLTPSHRARSPLPSSFPLQVGTTATLSANLVYRNHGPGTLAGGSWGAPHASPPRFSSLALAHRYPGVVVSARGAADVTHNDVYSNWGTMGRVSDKEHGARPASHSPILPPQARASRSASTVRDGTRLGPGAAAQHGTRARSPPTALSHPRSPSLQAARASTAICCTTGWKRASSCRRPTPPVHRHRHRRRAATAAACPSPRL